MLRMLVFAICLIAGFALPVEPYAGALPVTLPTDSDPVPYPVPVGYERCIIVIFSDAKKKQLGGNGTFFEPPIDRATAHAINSYWRDGHYRSVKHCTLRSS